MLNKGCVWYLYLRTVFFISFILLFSYFCLTPIVAHAAMPTLISTVSDPYPWSRVELWGSSKEQMLVGQEKLVKFSLPANTKVKSWLPADIFVKDGTSNSSNDYNFGDYGHLKSNRYFLLGYGPKWNTGTKPIPVLLVHGAGDDMNRAWAHPWDQQTPPSITRPGLMQYLSDRGYKVFAISFPHTQGNNLIHAELIADAIEVIKSRTGATQVDVIAHSKGNMAVTAYLSSLNNEWPDTTWMTDYRGDVRKYVAIAAPFKGLDTMFRYYTANLNVITENKNAPVAFYKAYIYYTYRNYYRWDMTDKYGGNYFEGQTQLLWNWVNDPISPIGFNSDSWTLMDGNDTMYKLYHGGNSLYVSSEGIDAAIANNNGKNGTSHFIAKLNNKGIDSRVKIYNLYGTNQTMGYAFGWWPIGEKAASSDGLVFVRSATYTEGITRRGAQLVAQQGYPYNHLDIARERMALNWIEQCLAQ